MTDIYEQLDSVYRQLIEKAHEARAASYSPYSGIAVGAALLTASGKIYLGSNIENASYSPTICAERVAFFKAVSAGEREFVAIAVVGARADEEPSREFPPCGVCRQVMSEFCGPDFVVLLGTRREYNIIPLSDLLPHTFTSDNFNGAEEQPLEEGDHEEEYLDEELLEEDEEYLDEELLEDELLEEDEEYLDDELLDDLSDLDELNADLEKDIADLAEMDGIFED